MLRYVFVLMIVFQFISCNNTKSDSTNAEVLQTRGASPDSAIADAFFPVTNYLRGQINDIREKGVNPMMYSTTGGRTDSAWLKAENFEKEMAPFFETTIDTANLKELFSEKKFLDQTLNAYTFTYDPKTTLPDSISLQHWDIYVDPNTNKVRRVYLITKMKDKKQQQLTWQSDKSCKIVTIGTDKNDNSIVEKEVFINWDF